MQASTSSFSTSTAKSDFWQSLLQGDAWQVHRNLQANPSLVNERADADSPVGDMLPLGCATFRRHRDAVRVLLEYGAEPNLLSSSGRSPLLLAVWQDDLAIAQMLVDHGADVNVGHPLAVAVSNGQYALAELLIRHGAQVNAPDSYGLTPLRTALLQRRADLVDFLLDHGAQANPTTRDQQAQSPLVLAICSGRLELVRLIVEKGGADVNARDERGRTALFWAIHKKCPALVQYLLDRGAIPSANNSSSNNIMSNDPLLLAIKKGNCDVVQSLLNHSSNVNVTSTPLFVAMQLRHAEMVDLLVQKGAHRRQEDDSLYSNAMDVLQYASLTENLDALYCLVKESPHVNLLAEHVGA